MISRPLFCILAFGAGLLGLLTLGSPVHRAVAAPVPNEIKKGCYHCVQCAEINGHGHSDGEGGGTNWVGFVQQIGLNWVPATTTAAGFPLGIHVRGAACIDSESEVVPQGIGYYEQQYNFGTFRCLNPPNLERIDAHNFTTPNGDPTGDPDDDPWTEERCPPSNNPGGI